MSLKTCMFLYVNYVHFGMTYMHYNTPSRTKHRNNVHILPSCICQDQAYRNALLHTSEPHSLRSGIPERIIFRMSTLFSVQNLKKKPLEDATRAMFLLFGTCINHSEDNVLILSVYLPRVYCFYRRLRKRIIQGNNNKTV
jgi:hypothetical protein